MNRLILTGRLNRDPEIRYTKEEIPMARFAISVKNVKSFDNRNTEDTFTTFECVARRGLAEVCGEYLKKGSLVAIEGKLGEHSVVRVDNMLMLDSKFYQVKDKEKKDSDQD